MSNLSNPDSTSKLSESNGMLNEPAIFKITSYMNVLGIIFIILGILVVVFSIIGLVTPTDNIQQFRKIGWILIIFQLFPLIIGVGLTISGFFLKQSNSRFQKFLYFKNIGEFNIGLDYQKRYFLITLIITIFGIVSAIIMFILSFVLIGSIIGNNQMIN
jgi:hypothetical protein